MTSFSFAALTDVGTVRTNNEDSALASSGLLALADGMGGHAAGEVASAVVMHSLGRLLSPAVDLTPDAMRESTFEARQTLRAMSRADHEMEGMGTTLIALGVGPDGIALAHVGDSRIYRVRDGEVSQITADHTHVQRLVDSGRLAPSEVRTHPYRSVILRSIDDTSDDLPDVAITHDIEPGDRVLLCSDGLSDYLDHDSLVHALLEGSPLEAARALLNGALDAGTRDNVTVIVADVHGAEPSAGDSPDTGAGDGAGDGAGAGDEVPVLVGASLAQAGLTAPARAVLLEAFPDAETLVDTLPRIPVDDADSDTLPTAKAVAMRAAGRREAAARAASAAAAAGSSTNAPAASVSGTAVLEPTEPGLLEPTESGASADPAVSTEPAVSTDPAGPAASALLAGTAPNAADVLENHLENEATAESGAVAGDGAPVDLEELFGPPDGDQAAGDDPSGENPNESDTDSSGKPDTPQRRQMTSRDKFWLGLVLVTFAAITWAVWFTES